MKKLIAITALAALVAAGCASKNTSQGGGTSETDNPGTSTGADAPAATVTSPPKSDSNPSDTGSSDQSKPGGMGGSEQSKPSDSGDSGSSGSDSGGSNSGNDNNSGNDQTAPPQ
jgi:lactocepin